VDSFSSTPAELGASSLSSEAQWGHSREDAQRCPPEERLVGEFMPDLT